MTEKELHKLSRHDLLHLLLTEVKENGSLQGQLEEVRSELEQTRESNDRLKIRINEREEQVQRLKEKLDKKDRLLDKKDAYISELENRLDSFGDGSYVGPGGFGSLAEATLQLNGVFEAAQSAADQYINSIKAMYEKMAATRKIPENGTGTEEIAQSQYDTTKTVDIQEDIMDLNNDSIVDLDEEERKAAAKAEREARLAAYEDDWAKIEFERTGTVEWEKCKV